MESWVGLGGKEGYTNIQISAEPGSNWGPCGRKAEILPTAPTMPADHAIEYYKEGDLILVYVFRHEKLCKKGLHLHELLISKMLFLINHNFKTMSVL